MTDLLDPLALAATAATVAAVVWIGHRADVARRRPPVVEIEPPAPAGLTPCRGMSNGGAPAVLTQTHRAWVIVPAENIGGPTPQMCEADPPAQAGATYADLVVQIDVPAPPEETPP